ncbi:class I SAM-dependent methyltransferase [Candidatus Gracilibacteria bacterium]|nr:class I SAM-dependent methyltransferase [Candidatus Gracilibacteria bacterium]
MCPDSESQPITRSIQAHAQAQFAPVAAAYVTSATHAHGADLARIVELASPQPQHHVLDVATGGGHTALAFARHTQHVVASDLTYSMLTAARDHIAAQGISHVTYCRNAAEQLPFAPARFDHVTCRIAAHHFADVRAFVAESARVLRSGGLFVVSDHIGLPDPDLDAFMDRFERWRDPSHVRAYSFAEWSTFCAAAGLTVIHTEEDQRDSYEFQSWTARMRMPADERAALEQWLLAAPQHLRDYFAVVETAGKVESLRGTFGIIVARKEG